MTDGPARRKTSKRKKPSAARSAARSKPAADWESRVLERIAGHVQAVLPGDDEDRTARYGWEDPSLCRLAKHLQRRTRK